MVGAQGILHALTRVLDPALDLRRRQVKRSRRLRNRRIALMILTTSADFRFAIQRLIPSSIVTLIATLLCVA